METPLVSVIMPAYNAEDFIGDAIGSVQKQTYKNWELYVIDDASTDATVKITRELAEKDQRIKLLRNSRNAGPGYSRNRGIEAASGRFICFLDADDLWLEQKLELQVKLMLERDSGMLFSSYYLLPEDAQEANKLIRALPVLTRKKLLRSNYVGNLTGMYDTAKTGKIYAPLIRKRQDWGLWLQVLTKTGSATGIPEPLAVYRQRKDSVSGNKAALLSYNFRIYKEVLGFGWLKSSRYMCRFLWEHFFIKPKQTKPVRPGK